MHGERKAKAKARKAEAGWLLVIISLHQLLVITTRHRLPGALSIAAAIHTYTPPPPQQAHSESTVDQSFGHSVSVRGIQQAIRAVAGGVMRQGAVQDGTQGGGGAQSSISGHAPRSQDKAVPASRRRKGRRQQPPNVVRPWREIRPAG